MEEGGGMPGQNRSLWGAREAAGAVEGQVVEKGWPGTEVSERAGESGPEQVIGAEGGRRDPHTHTSLPLRWQGGFVPCSRVDVRGAETCRKLWHGSEPPCTSGEDLSLGPRPHPCGNTLTAWACLGHCFLPWSPGCEPRWGNRCGAGL